MDITTKMPATQFLTEQAYCPSHNCPKDTSAHIWYDARYYFPLGSENAFDREAYWVKVNRPEGCWFGCPACWKMDNEIDNQLLLARKHISDITFRNNKKAHSNGKHKGAWELCFNYSPEWYENDYEAQEAMRLAINRLLRYYKSQIQSFRAVGEFTKAKRAHVHIYYRLESGGKFTDKNLKRAYPHWDAKRKVGTGVQGGHHSPVIDEANYLGYIEKDLDVSWLLVEYPNVEEVISQKEDNESSPSSSRSTLPPNHP